MISIDNIHKSYLMGKEAVPALRGVSLEIGKGEFVCLMGPSGSGKTTLLNIIGCIDNPTRGRVFIDDKEVTGLSPDALADLRARTTGFIFQTFNLFPVLTAAENVEYPLLQLPELDRAERHKRVSHFLSVVGLEKYADHQPNQLSGGQRQRVAIARALAINPRIVLADEPTANLDSHTGKNILGLMKEINRSFGTTFVFSTHDRHVMAMADRLIRIEDGRVAMLGVKADEKWHAVRPGRGNGGVDKRTQ